MEDGERSTGDSKSIRLTRSVVCYPALDMNRPIRRPAAFRLDDPNLVVTEPVEPQAAPPDAAPTDGDGRVSRVPIGAAERRRAARRMPWAAVFWVAAGGLVVLAIGLGVVNLVADLLSRSPWLGGLGAVFAAVAGIALFAIVLREGAGLMRLAAIEDLRARADLVLANDNRTEGRALGGDLIGLTRHMPQLARARVRFESHLGEIIDGADLVRLAERELMAPLDEEARRLVGAAAKRVSVVTAVGPRAAIDMLFVLVTALALMRKLALVYGGRPGTLALLRLMRQAVTHLALTGGMAASDGLIQQMVGHGVAARVSARLGEGLLNGLLTARLGLAAIAEIRPLPFTALRQPSLNDLASSLLRGGEIRGSPEPVPAQRPS
jgi:putative membrane protein